jgi:hypothetical protein
MNGFRSFICAVAVISYHFSSFGAGAGEFCEVAALRINGPCDQGPADKQEQLWQ